MSASIVAIGDLLTKHRGWTEQQRADLYRVAEILNRAGLDVSTECGMSDEGDPWFVFAREDTGEVIAHFARIDGYYVAASIPTGDTIRARSFKDVIDGLIRHQTTVPAPGRARWSEVYAHPLGAIAAFIAAALVVAHEKGAAAAQAAGDHASDAAGNPEPEPSPAATRPDFVHGQVVAAMRATPPSSDMSSSNGWEWLSIARAGLAAAMIAVTDAFAFAFEQHDDDNAPDDLVRIAGVGDTDASRGERTEREINVAPTPAQVDAGHHPGGDQRAAALTGTPDDALHHDLAAAMLSDDPAAFVFQPPPPQDDSREPAADASSAIGPAHADALEGGATDMTRIAADDASRSVAQAKQTLHDGVSVQEEVAVKPAPKQDAAAAAPAQNPATQTESQNATGHNDSVAAQHDTPPIEVAPAAVDTIGAGKTFVVGDSGAVSDHFSLVTSLMTVKLFDASSTGYTSTGSTTAAAGGTDAFAASPSTAAIDVRGAGSSSSSFGAAAAPLAASVSLSGGGEVVSSDDGRNQTIRLGAEADVVMVTPGASHIRIENFTAGVDRFYVSQWLLDHTPPDVSITTAGDVVMNFYGNFSVTLVGLAPPQPDPHPVGV
jgi:hypothetical protein